MARRLEDWPERMRSQRKESGWLKTKTKVEVKKLCGMYIIQPKLAKITCQVSCKKRMRRNNDRMRMEKTETSDTKEAIKFWSSIWAIAKKNYEGTGWLRYVTKLFNDTRKQEVVDISGEDAYGEIKKITNWKADLREGMKGFCYSCFMQR